MVVGVFEVFQSLRAVVAAATGDRSRSEIFAAPDEFGIQSNASEAHPEERGLQSVSPFERSAAG